MPKKGKVTTGTGMSKAPKLGGGAKTVKPKSANKAAKNKGGKSR